MFEVPESDITGVFIDEEVVLGKKPVEFIRTKNDNSDASNNNDSTTDLDSDKNIENLENLQKSKAKTYA